MIKPIFRLNGSVIKPPNNYESLALELNFDKDDPDYSGQVTTSRWVLGIGANDGDDGAVKALTHINGGLTGGVGALEGATFDISIQHDTGIENVFTGYLDLSDADITCDTIEAKAIELGGIDWLNEVADSFTFDYLAGNFEDGGTGAITQSDYVFVPYVINSIPDGDQIVILFVTNFMLVREILQIIREIEEWYSSYEVDDFSFGNILGLFIIVFQLGLLISAIIEVSNAMLNNMIQPIKYQAGMYARTLCQKGAEQLGLTFESTILDGTDGNGFERLVILSESYDKFSNHRDVATSYEDFIDKWVPDLFLGSKDPDDGTLLGHYKGTFGDLLRQLKVLFNGKLILQDGVLRLERRNYTTAEALYKLPPIDKRDIPYRLNVEDLNSNYTFSFALDVNDKTTFRGYAGTEVQVFQLPKTVNEKQLLLNKGIKHSSSAFTISKRKERLTSVERKIDQFLIKVEIEIGKIERRFNRFVRRINVGLKRIAKLIDSINSLPGINVPFNIKPLKLLAINFNPQQAANIKDRIGMLSLENDFIHIPKLVLLSGSEQNTNYVKNKLAIDTSDKLNAGFIYDQYYKIDSFVGDDHNQGKIYTIDLTHFCYSDYLQIKNNPEMFDSNGVTKAKVKSLKWNVMKQTATITFKTSEKWTDNLKEVKLLRDGR